MSAALHADGVIKAFRGDLVLRGIDIILAPGSVTVVRGEPDAGKSTLLRCLAGTYRLDGGTVRLRAAGEEHAVSATDARSVVWLRRHHLGLTDGRLVSAPREPAVAAVARTLERTGDDPIAAHAQALSVVEALGLSGVSDTPVGLLAPRAARALAVARSLLRPPAVLLLDEPTRGLDACARDHLTGLIRAARDAGTALLASTRSTDDLACVADATVHLREGRLT